jgi:hypothetical protein
MPDPDLHRNARECSETKTVTEPLSPGLFGT